MSPGQSFGFGLRLREGLGFVGVRRFSSDSGVLEFGFGLLGGLFNLEGLRFLWNYVKVLQGLGFFRVSDLVLSRVRDFWVYSEFL